MSGRSVEHATFVVERKYEASPDRAFAAWADPERLDTSALRADRILALYPVSRFDGNYRHAVARVVGAVARLASQKRLDRLLRAPFPTPLAERPRLRRFEGFADADECRWLIERARPKLAPAVVWDMDSGETRVDPYRSNSAVELGLVETDVVVAMLRARIAAATRLPEFIFELPQLMHYRVGEEFRPHHDYIDPDKPGFAADIARRGQRMGTFLVYLNDDFTGGETEFPKAGISVRARAGDALFFANVTPDGRPDPLTLHTGRPPDTGEKWILSQWIRDRPPTGSAPAPFPA